MGLTTCLALGALTFGGTTLVPEHAHRFLQLDPEAVVLEGRVGLELALPTWTASPEEPLEVVVTGLAVGVAPYELARERFTQPGMARALVRHRELATWEQVVVTWARPRSSGPAQGGVLARLVRAPVGGELFERPVGGSPMPSGGEINGGFIVYECPKTAKKGCTVHVFLFNPQTGKLEENKFPLEATGSLAISAMLPATHSCTGCK